MLPRALRLPAFFVLLFSALATPVCSQEKPAEGDKIQEVTIEVSGRAVDEAGKPIAGARIYLVSTNGVEKELGQTLTNGEGEYVFRNVKFPIQHHSDPGAIPAGTFQVYGEAKGFGFAWHGMRFYQAVPRSKESEKTAVRDTYFQDDAIEIDLTFSPEAQLTGTVKDEKGKPIAGAVLHLSSMDYLETEGREFHHNHREFWVQRLAPAHFREVKSDGEGRFTFKGLPAKTVGYATLVHPDYAGQSFYAAITDKPITSYEFISVPLHTIVNGVQVDKPKWETRQVRSGPLEITLVSTRRVKIRVVGDDNDAPMKEISVAATAENGTYVHGKTDKEGWVELKAPPGDYRTSLSPPRETEYVHTRGKLTVAADKPEQSAELRLTRGCILAFEAIDANDGSPIKGVSFWYAGREGDREFRAGVQSNTTWVNHPVTDEKGKMRAVVPPGIRKYGAGFTVIPGGYQGDLNGVEIDCESGKTIDVQFKLKKK